MHLEVPIMVSGLDTEALNSALWQQGPVKSHRALLPPPPFMVASAIESLKVSKWADRVQVVPREADAACARIAACDTVSILSNDSDLALFPMRPETRTIWLSTLEKKFNHKNKGSQLQASVLQPAVVAKRFRIASLLLLGFERHLDTSVTSAIVIDRARDHSRLASPREEYIAFASQYCLDQQPEQSLDLGGLDPRTAEYIVQANTSTEPPQVYFPVLHEDPSRDASWSYGAGIRQLSYSILASTASNSSRQREITEHYRKGPRISTTSVQLLGASEITSAINALLELLAPMHAISLAKTVGSWYSLALHLLTKEKLSRSRPIFLTSIHKLLGINMSRPIRPTWDDMHLNANAHAVLYSLRMLKQILVHTRVHQRSSPRIGPELNRLFEALYHMPTIEELFIDVLQLRLIMAAVGADTIRFMLRPIEGVLGVGDTRKQQRGNEEAHGKKRRRLETLRKVGVKIKSTNAFDILAASSDEADAD
jgi:XPG domain containing